MNNPYVGLPTPKLRAILDHPQIGKPVKRKVREALKLPAQRDGEKPTDPEAVEQMAGIQWLQVHGWQTWRIGQRDARGTQDPGVPDVVAIHPDHGLIWWEAKGKGGRQSGAQMAFEAACREAGVRYVCGGAATLRIAVRQITERTP